MGVVVGIVVGAVVGVVVGAVVASVVGLTVGGVVGCVFFLRQPENTVAVRTRVKMMITERFILFPPYGFRVTSVVFPTTIKIHRENIPWFE